MTLSEIETPCFIGLDGDGCPISWGETLHLTNTCAGSALARTVPATRRAADNFSMGGAEYIVISDSKAYSFEEFMEASK